MRRRLRLIFWLSLGLAFASGVVWLCMTAAAIDDISLFEIFNDGDFWAVVTGTQFGRTSLVRLMLGSLLAASVWYSGLGARPGDHSYVQLALGVAFLGSVAWLGHAAATPRFPRRNTSRRRHFASDRRWRVGRRIAPVCGCFSATFRRPQILGRVVTIVTVTKRFSGARDCRGRHDCGHRACEHVEPHWQRGAADETEYGRLLLLKLAIFFVMISIAAVNRFWLLPRLARQSTASH